MVFELFAVFHYAYPMEFYGTYGIHSANLTRSMVNDLRVPHIKGLSRGFSRFSRIETMENLNDFLSAVPGNGSLGNGLKFITYNYICKYLYF